MSTGFCRASGFPFESARRGAGSPHGSAGTVAKRALLKAQPPTISQ